MRRLLRGPCSVVAPGSAPKLATGRCRAPGCSNVLADTLDTEHIRADYDAGVLTLRIPIAERAKPRKIAIGGGSAHKEISG
jgi:hypothetical protein